METHHHQSNIAHKLPTGPPARDPHRGYYSGGGSESQSFLAPPSGGGSGVLQYQPPPSAPATPHPPPSSLPPDPGCHFDQSGYQNKQPEVLQHLAGGSSDLTRNGVQEEATVPHSKFFNWFPSVNLNIGPRGWTCHVCSTEFPVPDQLREHFHQYHVNPHHLSPEDSRLFRLSNFLVRFNEENEIKTEFPGLFRCHECFNVFEYPTSLRVHLIEKHSLVHVIDDPVVPDKMVVAAKMAPKIDKLSREDFEDSFPKSGKKPMLKTLKNNKNTGQTRNPRRASLPVHPELESQNPRRRGNCRLLQVQSTNTVNEFARTSHKERGKGKRRRPQRECKSRTSTLVAISLAEQEYEKFDLDFEQFKSDVSSPTLSECSKLSNQDCAENVSDAKIETEKVNGHILEPLDNVLNRGNNSEDSAIPVNETDVVKSMDENVFPVSKKKKIKRNKKNKFNGFDKKGIGLTKKRINKKSVDISRVKQKPKKSKASRKQISLKTNQKVVSKNKNEQGKRKQEAMLKEPNQCRDQKRPRPSKMWRPKIRDHLKASELVTQVVNPPAEFCCLICKANFSSYGLLLQHRQICKTSRVQMGNGIKQRLFKEDLYNDKSKELFEYVTGAVTKIPETSFNCLDGKITDLKTEDAHTYTSQPLSEIGLVKLNYSGKWSVKDAWESGGWEPLENQLTWQQYELSAAIRQQLGLQAVKQECGPKLKECKSGTTPPLADLSGIQSSETVKDKGTTNKSTDSPTDVAYSLTRKLTSQVVSGKAPLITNQSMDRDLVTKLSRLPWSEQKKVKEKFDLALLTNGRKSKASKSDKLTIDQQSSPGIRQSSVSSRLDLRQVGRSVKYMKVQEREAIGRPDDTKDQLNAGGPPRMIEGLLNGEWEQEHSFLCSVCGIEYDDVLEIMHHKWETHPHCLVSHVSLKEGLVRPPVLLYPQVGPSTVQVEEPNSPVPTFCSKCDQKFEVDGSNGSTSNFHAHILLCGGAGRWDISSNRRRKRRRGGHGGGLKSTVRMIQKGTNNLSRDGTDTDEPTPQKKPRSAVKIPPQPVIPSHNRTTRLKLMMKKEARKEVARVKRKKAKEQLKEHEEKKNKAKRKIDLKENQGIVASVVKEMLDKVQQADEVDHSSGEPAGHRRHRKFNRSTLTKKESKRDKNVGVRNLNKLKDSSETDQGSSSNSLDSGSESSNTNVSKKKLNTTKEIIKQIRKKKAHNVPNGKVQQFKSLKIKIESDNDIEMVKDLENLIVSESNCEKGDVQSPIKVNGIDSSRSSSVSCVSDLLLNSPDEDSVNSSKLNGTDIKVVKEETKRKRTPVKEHKYARSLKRLETSLVNSKVQPEEEISKRNHIHQSFRSKIQPSRIVLPIEVKISALGRVEGGETQAAVARDLNISPATLAAWWLRRAEIRAKFEREIMLESGEDLESTLAIAKIVGQISSRTETAPGAGVVGLDDLTSPKALNGSETKVSPPIKLVSEVQPKVEMEETSASLTHPCNDIKEDNQANLEQTKSEEIATPCETPLKNYLEVVDEPDSTVNLQPALPDKDEINSAEHIQGIVEEPPLSATKIKDIEISGGEIAIGESVENVIDVCVDQANNGCPSKISNDSFVEENNSKLLEVETPQHTERENNSKLLEIETPQHTEHISSCAEVSQSENCLTASVMRNETINQGEDIHTSENIEPHQEKLGSNIFVGHVKDLVASNQIDISAPGVANPVSKFEDMSTTSPNDDQVEIDFAQQEIYDSQTNSKIIDKKLILSMKTAFNMPAKSTANKTVTKKKSLNFLANCLMKKALAKSGCSSTSLSNSLNLEDDKGSQPTATGLGLILTNYCSSEEEL